MGTDEGRKEVGRAEFDRPGVLKPKRVFPLDVVGCSLYDPQSRKR
jgi:hypothetical protein